ncbi:MAG TPA: putative toxin-antitoxin system toxin component, PIN family [Longimicrobium sp.]|nr:putative toxin-antitoxin system toxin component, PIN family [Longimicrobium sp.]
MKIVIDTNVLVSGLLSPAGPPGRIVDLIATETVCVLYDDRILAEYREVLARPKLGINPREVAILMEEIELRGLLVFSPPLPIELPDADDLPFVEVAHAGAAAFLITGNVRHFLPAQDQFLVPVVTPATFLTLWLSDSAGTN